MINQEPPGEPLTAGTDALRDSCVRLGREGLDVRAGRHLYLHISLQLLMWLITISFGAGAGSVISYLQK
jgi:hypothetical protein